MWDLVWFGFFAGFEDGFDCEEDDCEDDIEGPDGDEGEGECFYSFPALEEGVDEPGGEAVLCVEG